MAATALVTSLSGCIDETFPESSTAIESQMSNAGLSSAIKGMSAQFTQGYLVYGEQEHETDMAYPQLMIAQTEMLGDIYPEGSNSGYDWYRTYNTFSASMNENSYFSYLPWRTLYMFVKSANDAVKTYKAISDPTDENKNYAAQAYTYRAFDYYMLMVLFEPKANPYTDCSSVLGLTVPIVTDETTEDQAKNNKRATHKEMVDFILADLQNAVDLYTSTGFQDGSSTAPTLQVTYGVMSKVYLWDEQYDKAFEYADKAIKLAEANGATMMNKSELTNATSAFTTATKGWMWYTAYPAENMENLANFTGWISAEADWGYSSLTMPAIDASLYHKMGINDYRRKQFLDPDRKRGDYETCRTQDWIMDAPDYLALKFRCKNGDYQTYSVGAAVDVPIMRLEELYLIRAEAAGMSQSLAAGVKYLTEFVQKNRDLAYKCNATTTRELQLAVLDQMRIEFWGEGNAFPSAKRIQPGIIQNYTGTNAPADIFKINCKGIKPNWNLVIPINETQSNQAIAGFNNPDPTSAIKGPSPINEYAEGKYDNK